MDHARKSRSDEQPSERRAGRKTKALADLRLDSHWMPAMEGRSVYAGIGMIHRSIPNILRDFHSLTVADRIANGNSAVETRIED
jgi:hypothetical protein